MKYLLITAFLFLLVLGFVVKTKYDTKAKYDTKIVRTYKVKTVSKKTIPQQKIKKRKKIAPLTKESSKENDYILNKVSKNSKNLCDKVPCPLVIGGEETHQSCKLKVNPLDGKKYGSCECDEGSMRKNNQDRSATNFCTYDCDDINCHTGECADDGDGGILCRCNEEDDVQYEEYCLPKKCSKNDDCNGYYGGEFCNRSMIDYDMKGPQKSLFMCGSATGSSALGASCNTNQECISKLCLDGKCTDFCSKTDDCLFNSGICELILNHFNQRDYLNTFSYLNICTPIRNINNGLSYNSPINLCSNTSIDLCSSENFCAHNILDFKTINSNPNDDSNIEYLCLSKPALQASGSCYSDSDCTFGHCTYNGEDIIDMCGGDSKCINKPIKSCASKYDCQENAGGTCVYREERDRCFSSSECATQICSILERDCSIPGTCPTLSLAHTIKKCRKACITDDNCANGHCIKALPYNSGFIHPKTNYDNGDYLKVCDYN